MVTEGEAIHTDWPVVAAARSTCQTRTRADLAGSAALRRPAHRPAPGRAPRCSRRSASAASRSWSTPRCRGRIRPDGSTLPARRHERGRGPPSCGPSPTRQPAHLDDRARLPRHVTPPVIQRNVLENPAWYTAYTPYQPEISQGRLEALLNFQTMVADLTGLDRQRLDARRGHRGRRGDDAGPSRGQKPTGRSSSTPTPSRRPSTSSGPAPSRWASRSSSPTWPTACPTATLFGVLLQYPAPSGRMRDPRPSSRRPTSAARSSSSPPTCWRSPCCSRPASSGADVAVGTTQRFGVPLGYGGPHAGYMAVRDGLERTCPGRLVGVSVDADGRPAYRLALQTREQHIRREKATSNICTAQVLLAVMASMYAVYHGPEGLRRSPRRAPPRRALADGAPRRRRGGRARRLLRHRARPGPGRAAEVVAAARDAGINLRRSTPTRRRGPSTRRPTRDTLEPCAGAFGVDATAGVDGPTRSPPTSAPDAVLTHAVFHAHRSETAMLRYLRRLSDQDLALDRG